ncbi:MAG: acyl-CoA thioesterase II [bacterium]|nr:acyl-CoA thioesterase II [bacterium]
MRAILEDLIHLLDLERLDTNLFRGESRDIGTNRVFGGQVLGQALAAANRTVEERTVHSLHAYFLRQGDQTAPIIYEVDRQRDGRTYASRRVVAIQHGRPILNLAASFQRPEEGVDHQATMPEVPDPETLKDAQEYRRELIDRCPEASLPRFLRQDRPFEFRPVQPPQIVDPVPSEPRVDIWFKTVDRIGDDDALHRNILAYVSDYYLITTAARPHGYSLLSKELMLASLDHALWFQRPFRVDEWLLYSIESPSASGARGLARGLIFRQDGTLAAAVAQEGLLRVRTRDRE